MSLPYEYICILIKSAKSYIYCTTNNFWYTYHILIAVRHSDYAINAYRFGKYHTLDTDCGQHAFKFNVCSNT